MTKSVLSRPEPPPGKHEEPVRTLLVGSPKVALEVFDVLPNASLGSTVGASSSSTSLSSERSESLNDLVAGQAALATGVRTGGTPLRAALTAAACEGFLGASLGQGASSSLRLASEGDASGGPELTMSDVVELCALMGFEEKGEEQILRALNKGLASVCAEMDDPDRWAQAKLCTRHATKLEKIKRTLLVLRCLVAGAEGPETMARIDRIDECVERVCHRLSKVYRDKVLTLLDRWRDDMQAQQNVGVVCGSGDLAARLHEMRRLSRKIHLPDDDDISLRLEGAAQELHYSLCTEAGEYLRASALLRQLVRHNSALCFPPFVSRVTLGDLADPERFLRLRVALRQVVEDPVLACPILLELPNAKRAIWLTTDNAFYDLHELRRWLMHRALVSVMRQPIQWNTDVIFPAQNRPLKNLVDLAGRAQAIAAAEDVPEQRKILQLRTMQLLDVFTSLAAALVLATGPTSHGSAVCRMNNGLVSEHLRLFATEKVPNLLIAAVDLPSAPAQTALARSS